MKKTVLILSLMVSFNANAWEACGTDAKGNTANCEYQIENGTLTIRGTNGVGNIGQWYSHENGYTSPFQNLKVQNIVIENSVKNLGNWAFKGISCSGNVEIQNGIQEISSAAFRGLYAAEVIIPESVKRIEGDAFNSTHIEKIDIPESIERIGIGAFRDTIIKELVLPDSAYIEDKVLGTSRHLETLVVGENTSFGKIFDVFDYDTLFTNISNLKIYCTGDTAKCDANLEAAGYGELKSIKATTKQVNGVTYVYDASGKLVTTSGRRTEKRIYTIDEANTVAGTTNHVKIRYR